MAIFGIKVEISNRTWRSFDALIRNSKLKYFKLYSAQQRFLAILALTSILSESSSRGTKESVCIVQ